MPDSYDIPTALTHHAGTTSTSNASSPATCTAGWKPSTPTRRPSGQLKCSVTDRYRIFAITCPFHGNAGWRWIRDHDPHGWAEAVEFDKAIREGYPRATEQGQQLRGQYFLHRTCQPLGEVDLDPPAPATRHLQLVSAPATVEEQDDPDGCSPWSCRSGTAVAGPENQEHAP